METTIITPTPLAGKTDKDDERRKKMAMIEATLFMAGRPMSLKELAESIGTTRKPALELVRALVLDYVARGSALEIFVDDGKDSAGMRVRHEFLSHVRDLSTLTDISDGEKKTLAIVAFYQPIRQSEIIKIRGNRAYNQLKKLEGAGLVRAEPKGSTKILATTHKFTEYFGNMDMSRIKKQLDGKQEDNDDATLKQEPVEDESPRQEPMDDDDDSIKQEPVEQDATQQEQVADDNDAALKQEPTDDDALKQELAEEDTLKQEPAEKEEFSGNTQNEQP